MGSEERQCSAAQRQVLLCLSEEQVPLTLLEVEVQDPLWEGLLARSPLTPHEFALYRLIGSNVENS